MCFPSLYYSKWRIPIITLCLLSVQLYLFLAALEQILLRIWRILIIIHEAGTSLFRIYTVFLQGIWPTAQFRSTIWNKQQITSIFVIILSMEGFFFKYVLIVVCTGFWSPIGSGKTLIFSNLHRFHYHNMLMEPQRKKSAAQLSL